MGIERSIPGEGELLFFFEKKLKKQWKMNNKKVINLLRKKKQLVKNIKKFKKINYKNYKLSIIGKADFVILNHSYDGYLNKKELEELLEEYSYILSVVWQIFFKLKLLKYIYDYYKVYERRRFNFMIIYHKFNNSILNCKFKKEIKYDLNIKKNLYLRSKEEMIKGLDYISKKDSALYRSIFTKNFRSLNFTEKHIKDSKIFEEKIRKQEKIDILELELMLENYNIEKNFKKVKKVKIKKYYSIERFGKYYNKVKFKFTRWIKNIKKK